jgi:hypothetical protein
VIVVEGDATPSWSAAEPVICLKIEPGAYCSASAWLTNGFFGSPRYCS